jgi:purine-cytosine permease-like protein
LVTGLVLAQVADDTGLDVIFWIAAGALVVAAVLYVGIDRSQASEDMPVVESGATDLPSNASDPNPTPE